jgi:hypothetical protein
LHYKAGGSNRMSCTAENYYEVTMEAQAAKLAERDMLVANEEKPETILA